MTSCGQPPSLLLTLILFASLPPILSSFSWTASSVLNVMKGGSSSSSSSSTQSSNNNDPIFVQNDAERRWEALMTHCLGNWSGSIGWYHPTEDQEQQQRQQPRDEESSSEPSRRLNVRMGFQLRDGSDAEVADWIVHHARSLGSKDHVVIRKHPDPRESALQALYCFRDGIVGRAGRNLRSFPVVEHGFWADGARRTAVLVWKDQRLDRICYMQQQKQPIGSDFDVSATNADDIGVLPNEQPRVMSLEERNELFQNWTSCSILDTVHVSDNHGKNLHAIHVDKDDAGSAIVRLLGPSEEEENVLRIYLPNGVLVACPKSLAAVTAPFDIVLGYQRPACGQIQILELQFVENGELQVSRASWYKRAKIDAVDDS